MKAGIQDANNLEAIMFWTGECTGFRSTKQLSRYFVLKEQQWIALGASHKAQAQYSIGFIIKYYYLVLFSK